MATVKTTPIILQGFYRELLKLSNSTAAGRSRFSLVTIATVPFLPFESASIPTPVPIVLPSSPDKGLRFKYEGDLICSKIFLP
jgi:hypothetical protein